VQGYVGMVGRVIVHQRYKQTNDIYQPKQGKEKKVYAAGKKRTGQTERFGKVNKEEGV